MMNRMGSKQGGRMERAVKKEEQMMSIKAAHNQTVKYEEESMIPLDDCDDSP